MLGSGAMRLLPLALVGALAVGCGAASEGGPDAGAWQADGWAEGAPAPDFALKDFNPTSGTYRAEVSPRDVLEKVSGWYFTHAS